MRSKIISLGFCMDNNIIFFFQSEMNHERAAMQRNPNSIYLHLIILHSQLRCVPFATCFAARAAFVFVDYLIFAER